MMTRDPEILAYLRGTSLPLARVLRPTPLAAKCLENEFKRMKGAITRGQKKADRRWKERMDRALVAKGKA